MIQCGIYHEICYNRTTDYHYYWGIFYTMNYKKNLILVLVITGMIRVLFVAGSIGGVIWCRHTNCVTTDTELIKK